MRSLTNIGASQGHRVTGSEIAVWSIGAMPSGVAASHGVIVTADRDDNALTIIRGADTTSSKVGTHPFGVTLQGGLAYSADVLSATITVLELESGQIIATIPTGERPYALAIANNKGFVTNQYDSSVTVFDITDHHIIDTLDVGDYPEGIAATADGSRIVVANWFSDTVSLIDTDTLNIVAEVDVPEGPRAFGTFTAPKP